MRLSRPAYSLAETADIGIMPPEHSPSFSLPCLDSVRHKVYGTYDGIRLERKEAVMGTRYVFRVGPSPSYRDKERSYPSLQEARDAAYDARTMGWSTSRILRVDDPVEGPCGCDGDHANPYTGCGLGQDR